jgi:hypothetical protein
MTVRRRKRWLRPLAISVALHLTFVTAAAVYLFFTSLYLRPEPAPQEPNQGAFAGAPPKDDLDAARERADELMRRAEGLSDAERKAELDEHLEALDKMSLEVVDAAASLAERLMGASPRRVAPSRIATGRFDPDSATIYDVRRRIVRGREVYEITYVDKAGRTLRGQLPPSACPGNMALLAGLMGRARRDAKFRRLMDAALRVLEPRVRRQPARRSRPPATQPRPR